MLMWFRTIFHAIFAYFTLVGEKVKRMAEVQQSMLPLWKQFLLNQFHDVIPGSCIQKVVEDAMQIYHGEWE